MIAAPPCVVVAVPVLALVVVLAIGGVAGFIVGTLYSWSCE